MSEKEVSLQRKWLRSTPAPSPRCLRPRSFLNANFFRLPLPLTNTHNHDQPSDKKTTISYHGYSAYVFLKVSGPSHKQKITEEPKLNRVSSIPDTPKPHEYRSTFSKQTATLSTILRHYCCHPIVDVYLFTLTCNFPACNACTLKTH